LFFKHDHQYDTILPFKKSFEKNKKAENGGAQTGAQKGHKRGTNIFEGHIRIFEVIFFIFYKIISTP
jgi:hypothetical protein